MSKTRAIIVMLIGFFLLLHGIGDIFDGTAEVATRYGAIRDFTYAESFNQFIRTVVMNIILGVVPMACGYYYYRKADK